MKRLNENFVLIAVILAFLVSYSLDQQVNGFFNSARFKPLDAVLGIITYFAFDVAVMLAIPSLMLFRKNRKIVYLMLLSFILSFMLAFAIKLIVLRQRPVNAFTYPFTNIISYSFPSMHAMVVFSLLPVLLKHLQKQKAFWITFAFLAAFSRVYFGFHFLSDVVFGGFLGFFIGKFLLKLHEKGKLWK